MTVEDRLVNHSFRDLTWPQIGEAIEQNALLLLPFGQTEEHGRHLGVGTDSIIAERVCEAVAARLAPEIRTLVLPSIQYGYSSSVMTKWPGTFVVRTRAVMDLLLDVCVSAIQMGFKKLAIVNTHGHHWHLAVVVAREVADATGVHVAVTAPHHLIGTHFAKVRKSPPGGAIHAGEFETSLMMHFGYPVDLSAADDRDLFRYRSEFVGADSLAGGSKVFWSTWGLQSSQSGAFGDPTTASAETGRQCMDLMVEAYASFLGEFYRFKLPGSEEP